MAKSQALSSDKKVLDLGSEYSTSSAFDKKPNWVNLAQLDGPLEDSLTNRFLYKPALRFHGITGGIWGQGLSDAHSVTSESRPPSYRFVDSLTSPQHGGDGVSASDVDTLYNTANIPAQSPLTLRRRNTVAVIVVAIALLAAVAAITGIILHFLHPKAMLRANVRLTIANRNYTDDMKNSSSLEFHEIARPLCEEMDVYFLTSELADFYLGCNVVSMTEEKSKTKNGTAVHYTLDFIDNKVTNDGERIKKIIMRKSGRQQTKHILYLSIRDFLVYLRSLKIDVEVLPLPDDHPGRRQSPRIPWNKDVDFIARKSNNVKHSGTNTKVLTDTKELTKNVPNQLQRNSVKMSTDIPGLVLPGGEIRDLPIITPTQFYQSATPLSHTHAFQLQTDVKELPVLSHVFQNVSVSNVVDTLSNETVYYGAGAFINPSASASVVSIFVSTRDFQRMVHIPNVREINVNNDVIARRISQNDAFTNMQGIGKHNSIENQIETSFKDISHNFRSDFVKTNELVQTGRAYNTKDNIESLQKVFTLFTDVFVIIGSKTDILPTSSKPSSNNIDQITQLNEFEEEKGHVQKKPISSSSLPLLPSFQQNLPILKVTEVHSQKPFTKGSKNEVVHNLITEEKIDYNNDHKDEILNHVPADSNIEINEMVVDLPVQKEIIPAIENVKWINLFNQPQRTVDVLVGDIFDQSGMPYINNSHSVEAIPNIDNFAVVQRAGRFNNFDISNGIQREGGSNRMHSDSNKQDPLNLMDKDFNHSTHGNITNFEKIGTTSSKRKESNKKLPNVITRHVNNIRQNKHNQYPNNLSIKQPKQDFDFSWRRLKNHVDNIKDDSTKSNNLQIPDINVPRIDDIGVNRNHSNYSQNIGGNILFNNESGRFHQPVVSITKTIRPWTSFRIPQFRFIRRRGFMNGRDALVVSHVNRTSQIKHIQMKQIDKVNSNNQPWNFLRRIGVNLAFYDSNLNEAQASSRNSRISDSTDKRARSRIQTNMMVRRLQHGNLFRTNVNVFNPYQETYLGNRGLPKSPDFSDIEDMKKILRHLVDNMYNMTTKIDHMQDAINFINKTFHETHSPLLNLQETLGNMTISLGNLNQNLNIINATMTAFKDFIKQFGNNVFNIDDIIKHIDDTIGNLGNAVSFIGMSMIDINGTVNGISDNVIDMNNTLKYVNRSVLDVNNTATYSNDTLDSMQQTLISLEHAIKSLSFKVNIINKDSDKFDISLKNINETVKNTHKKLDKLHWKLMKFNSSMSRVVDQAHRLKQTYNKINKTLYNMNEPFMFINGTILEVIEKLSTIDERLFELNKNMDVAQSNITVMNTSLLASIDWLDEMVHTLTKFNLWMESYDDTLHISLKNKDMLETVSMLLDMNGTLSDIGLDVDHINVRLDKVDLKLENLEEQLLQIDKTLDDIDVKFKLLDKTLKSINTTLKDTGSSLKTMNLTIEAIKDLFELGKISFGHINETLGTVNKTLIMINDTAEEINSTVTNVNKTFNGLENTVNRTTESAKQQKSLISEFIGTVRELNSQLYNANESMRITMNKADIATKSYMFLNNTLAEVDKTVTELQIKLDETNSTLRNTDTSLEFLNNSILAIQESFQKLGTDLSKIQASYSQMNESMHRFGHAFPTIQTSLQEMQEAMIKLQDEISHLDDELKNDERKRDLIVYEKLLLNYKLKVVADRLGLIQSTIKGITNRSKEIGNTIVIMNESVSEAIEIYNKTEKNIMYINDSHGMLRGNYDNFQQQSDRTNKSLTTLSESLKELEEDFEKYFTSIDNYSNVDLKLDTMSYDLVGEVMKYENAKTKFKHWKLMFRNADKVTWGDDGNPSLVHAPYITLVNETERVNETMNTFGKVMKETETDIKEISNFIKSKHSQLRSMYKLKNKIDAVDTMKFKVSDKIAVTDKTINGIFTDMTKVKNDLLNKLEYIENMKIEYGNINGTFNSSLSFEKIENDIRSSLEKMNTAMNLHENTSKFFREEVFNFTAANTTYHQNIYNLSSESKMILNNTLEVMINTKAQFKNVNKNLKELSTIVESIENKTNNTNSEIKSFEKKLQNKKAKNNFIMQERSLLEAAYQRAFRKLQSIDERQEKLFGVLKTLQNTSKALKNLIDEKPNVNVSITTEERQVKNFLNKIMNFKNDLRTIDVFLNTYYNRFLNFDDLKHTLQDIQKEYEQHHHAVDHFQTVIKVIPAVHVDISTRTGNISETFEDLLRQLTELLELKQPVHNANVSVHAVKAKLNSTWENVHDAEFHMLWLKAEFSRIKDNYTNFTGTETDLTESYVIEAINDIDRLLSNLTSDLKNTNASVSSLLDKYDTVEKTFTKEIFNRFNIDKTIQNIIVPTLQDISDQNGFVSNDLDLINSKIRRLELSIQGVNETIHIKNKQLFIDRQKKLLADTKFPELESAAEHSKNYLFDSIIRLNETKADLEGLIKLYENLNDRLKQYPHVNVSLTDTDKRLRAFNESIYSTFDRLDVSKDLLNKLNNTLWVEDEKRYSNNETFDDVKKRYNLVNEMLKTIFEDLSDIDLEISSLQNGSREIFAQLTSLNTSLDDVDNSNKLFDNLYREFTSMELDFEDTSNKVKGHSKRFSGIIDSFRSIEDKLKNVNKSVFNELVNQFTDEKSNLNTSVDYLNDMSLRTSNDLEVIRTLFDLVKEINKKTPDSHTGITESVFEQNHLLRNISKLLETVEMNINDMKYNSSHVKQALQNLESKRLQIERDFYRQEKLEYVEKYFPKDTYDNLNDTIAAVMRANSGLRSHFKLIHQHFNELMSNLSKNENINFDISQIGKSLLLANASVANNSAVLRNISNEYMELKSLLYADDGSIVSDAESIDDLKKRYEIINNQVDNITAALLSMKDNIVQQNFILKQNAERITMNQKLLTSYEKVTNDIFAMKTSNENWTKTFDTIQNSNKERHDTFLSLHDSYNAICSAFNRTTNNAIKLLKSHIDEDFKTLSTKLSYMDESINATLKNVSNAKEVIDSYVVKLLGSHVDSDLLRQLLLEYKDVKNAVNKGTSLLPQMNTTLIEDGIIVDDDILILQFNIENLRLKFTAQHKQDYIENNVPELIHLLQKAKNDTKQAEIEVDQIRNSSKSLQTLFEKTTDILRNASFIESPLIRSTNLLKTSRNSLKTYEHVLDNGIHYLNNIDETIFNNNGSYYSSNGTYKDIVNIFDNLKHQLLNVSKNMSQVMQKKHDLEVDLNKEEMYLNELYDENIKLQSLKKAHHSSNQDILTQKRKLQIAVMNYSSLADGKKYLVDRLADIVHRYKNVKEKSLSNDVENISKDLESLEEGKIFLIKNINNTDDSMLNIALKRDQIIIVLNTTLNSLDELTDLITKAQPIQNEITKGINLISNKTKEIINVMDTNLNMIPTINQSISRLQEKFRQQEIHEYITDNFPSLLKYYDQVNRTLDNLQERILDVDKKLMRIQNKSSLINRILNDSHPIEISLDYVSKSIDQGNASLESVIRDKNQVQIIYKDLENVISNSVGSNETLRDIKERFAGYEKLLLRLFSNMTAINDTLSEIDDKMDQSQTTIDLHNEALNNFYLVQKNAEQLDMAIEKLQDSKNSVENDLELVETKADKQKLRFKILSVKYDQINSSLLINEHENIGHNINDLMDSLTKTRQEINEKKMKLENVLENNIIVKQNLVQPIKTIDQLKTVTADVKDKINSLSDNMLMIETGIESNVRPELLPYNKTVNKIEKDISNLEEKYKEQEKNDFYLTNFQHLMQLYEMMNKSLHASNTSLLKSISRNNLLNKTIKDLQEMIDSFPTVKISTEKDMLQLQLMQENHSNGSSRMNGAENLFIRLDTNIFLRKDWSNSTIDEMKTLYNDFMKNISSLNSTINDINSFVLAAGARQNESFNKLNESKSTLDKYQKYLNTSVIKNDSLHKLSDKLNKTHNLLEDVKKQFYNDGDRLLSLTQKYHNTTSIEIENMVDKIRMIIDGTVGLRIPLANKLFSKRLIENYDVVSARFVEVVYILNKTFTSINQIENIFGNVDESLTNITLETETMVDDEKFYREDAIRLSEHLNNSHSLLDQLEDMFEVQAKKDLLQKSLPKLIDTWNKANSSLFSVSDKLLQTFGNIDDVFVFVKDLKDMINEIKNVNISTEYLFSNLSIQKDNLTYLNESVVQLKNNISTHQVIDIDDEELVNNKSVTVIAVLKKLENLNMSLSSLNNSINYEANMYKDIKMNFSNIKDAAMLLNGTIFSFKVQERDVGTLNQTLHDTLDKLKYTEFKMKETGDRVKDYKHSLTNLKKKYKDYRYDSRDVEILVNMTENTIEKLNESLSKSDEMLSESGFELKEMTAILYNSTDDLSILNRSINQVQSLIPPTMLKVRDVDRFLDNITDSIPDLTIELNDIADFIHEMNISLMNEDQKASFADTALPILKEKYEKTNRTFEMTNKTLERMADEIDLLNEYIETLKLRMTDFSTINISLSDFDANITHLENRLLIMKEHYDNVKGIVNTFRKDMSVNNIFGRNISLADVEDQYKSFNDSLDLIDEVLAKIDNEAYEMDEHFEFLNETMSGIDHALDRFETKQINTKIMEQDLENFGKDLSITNDSISRMQDVVNDFHEKFGNMNILYSDVLHSTTEKNTLVKKLLETTNESLVGLQSSVERLSHIYDKITNEFVDMNGTLFKNIDTYVGLNNTLDDVKSKYLKLRKSLTNLEKDVNEAKQEAIVKNATISKLSVIMDFINETLYNEKIKYDFIKNNLENLAEKFKAIKSPIERTKITLSEVTDNISNTSNLVKGVSHRLKSFPNVRISLLEKASKLKRHKTNVSEADNILRDIASQYKILQNNITNLDNRSGNVKSIQDKYRSINESLDNLHVSLSDTLNTLENVNKDTNSISNEANELDGALDKFNGLNISAESLTTNISKIKDNLETTSLINKNTHSNANELKSILEEMQNVYSSLNDKAVSGNITDLIENLHNTTTALTNVNERQKDLLNDTQGVMKKLTETKERLNSDVHNQEILDSINIQSEILLNHIKNETDLLHDSQGSLASDASDIQNTLDLLTNEILRLNDTLAEEKKKREFIATHFPHMKKRHETLNNILNSSNSKISDVNLQTEKVAIRLATVKERLNNITAITIPLDSENDEVIRIRKAVGDVSKKFENFTKVYDNLNIDGLKNLESKYDILKEQYRGFDESMNEIEKGIKKMNDELNDINNTAVFISKSVRDINATVDEYIESGDMLNNFALSSDNLSSNIGRSNHSIDKISEEVQALHDVLNTLLQNYSHINDSVVSQASNIIRKLLNSSSNTIDKLAKKILHLTADTENAKSIIGQMNQTHLTTKNLLIELKQHIKDVNNNSSNLNASLNDIWSIHADINKSVNNVSPKLKNAIDMIANLNNTLVKEQEKLDFIAFGKPLIKQKFKDLLRPLEMTNNHLSFTEVKLADLKYEIITTGSRLDKFKSLNFTTSPELQRWNTMNNNVKNASKSFYQLSDTYKELQQFLNAIDDRNLSLGEIKQKFDSINSSLNDVELKLENVNTMLSDTENDMRETENVISGLQTSMDSFKELQTEAIKTKQSVNDLHNIIGKFESDIYGLRDKGSYIKKQLEDMKTKYAPLNNTNWNKMQPIFDRESSAALNNLNNVNESVNRQRTIQNSIAIQFDDIISEINSKYLTRKNVDLAISSMHNKLNTTKERIAKLDKPLMANKQKIKEKSASMNSTKIRIDEWNTTLHNEILKHDFVNQNLPSLKEKYANVNVSYRNNLPNVKSMKDKITQLVSIIERIKDKMRLFGVDDTDNSIKKWDLAIQNLNSTVANVLRQNEEAGDKMINLKSKLWTNDTFYSSTESLADVITRFDNYNKTLDEISAASHTIDIKLANFGTEFSGIIGQLLERDSILTTTPATTTPSGPPDWLTFQSTATGVIGKDPGFATCAVEDLNQWDIMKITRVNKDGRKEAIAAWKLGVGARKAVRDRRIRVKRTKTATGGKMTVGIQTLQCEDEGTYYCAIDSYKMWPLESSIGVITPPEDDLKPDFPTEVFQDKVANFSCMGHPGYPNGRITWKIKREKEVEFRPFEFYSSKPKVTDTSCVRTETNTVEYQFDLQWNNTKVRCYIENTDFYAEGIIRLLPYDICNKVRYLGTISHPYTPHKYIVCGKELNIMQCPGNTCYDEREENCVRCKAGSVGSDPCLGQPLFSYVAHETDCKKYYICMGPTKTAKKCTKGYFAPNIPGNCVMSYAQSHCGRKAG